MTPTQEALNMAVTTPTPLVVQSESGQVMDLFRRAFEAGGATPEALAQLVALKEQIERRNAELEFARAMVEFQTSCPPIPKTSIRKAVTNAGVEVATRYADFEQIVETVRPHLHRLGLSFTFDGRMDGQMWTTICTLRHRNGHSVPSTFTLPTESRSPLMTAQDKVAGANTYAKRQCLISVLGLSLTDPDTEGDGGEPITEEQAANFKALLEEVKADREKVLVWLRAVRVEDLSPRAYAAGIKWLEEKRKK